MRRVVAEVGGVRRALRNRLRSRYDYARFRFERDLPYWLSLGGLVLGAASVASLVTPDSFPPEVPVGMTVVGFGAATLVFRRDHRAQRERAVPVVIAERTAALPPPGLPRSYAGATIVTHARLGAAVLHEEADAALADTPVEVEWLAEPFLLDDTLRATAVQVVGAKVKAGEIAFNGQTVRLLSDIVPPLSTSVVQTQPSSYFDNLCSNHLAAADVHLRGRRDDADLTFVDRFVLDRQGALRELAGSRLANVIGISTLAFTADGQLLLTHQSARSGASRNLLAPSGSGSLEPRDGLSDAPARLADVIARGMERELAEEINLPHATALTTRLTGFARWMDYGGKPEFLGVTRIGAQASREILARAIRRDERDFVVEVRPVHVDLSELATVTRDGPLDEIPGVPASVSVNASMPLLLALRALGRRLADDRSTRALLDSPR